MRATVVAAVLGTFFGYAARGEVENVEEGCPAAQLYMPPNSRVADKPTTFKPTFEVTTLVRGYPPSTHQTTAAVRTDRDAKDQNAKKSNETVNYSLLRAAVRPFLTTLNANALRQCSMAFEASDDVRLSAPDELEDLQIQILKRTPLENQSFKPHRLSMALTLSVMMAAYGWKMGSYSGLKCCVLLLFLVSFHLRSMHDTLV